MHKVFDFIRHRRRIRAAARWHARVQDNGAVVDSPELRLWLGQPENRQAYDRIGQAWTALGDYERAPEMLVVRREALSRLGESKRQFLRPSFRITGLAAAMGLLLVGAIGIGALVRPDNSADFVVYATKIGQRHVATLSDGSQLWLDSDSAVRVQNFDHSARKLLLVRGRARFDVALDKSRPFEVTAGDETTVAVGTSFDVERLNGKFLVTVREGRVRISAMAVDPGRAQPVFLAAGQELTTEKGRRAITSVDLLAESAWLHGKIVLNDERLDDAVGRINRYLDKPLLVSAEVASIRVSGIFNAGDAHAFVSALTSYFPIQSRSLERGQVVLEKRA